MKIPYYQVDVFSDRLFKGNPAGVCLLPSGWLSRELMQNIAFENNISETAFIVKQGDGFELRWFTPFIEMDLCGHATLAPAHVLFTEAGLDAERIEFETRSGLVSVAKGKDKLILDFPSRAPTQCEEPAELENILGKVPSEVWRSRDYLIIYEDEDDIRSIDPILNGCAS
jgi:PhzF family phenazine biosynthesis protein